MTLRIRAVLVGLAVVAALAVAAPGTAVAAPAAGSACDGYTTGTIVPEDAATGHQFFTVTLRAKPGTRPCTVSGRPSGIVLVDDNTDEYRPALRPTGTPAPVVFGPGHPISFEFASRNRPGGPLAHYVIIEWAAGDTTVKLAEPTTITGPLQVNPFMAAR